MNTPRLIDSHAHVTSDKFAADLDAVLDRAAAAGVDLLLDVGTDLPSSERARDFAHARPNVYAAAGIHPHEADAFDDALWPRLEALWADPRVRGVGETGLDYYYDHSQRDRQRALFRRHLEAAGRVGRPVVIHCRDAFDDLFALLGEVGLPAGGVMHCFTGGPAEAELAVAHGLYISFSGILTFKNADNLRAAVPLVPADRLLVETDCPYLAPLPYRGKRNEPAYVVETARKLAELRGSSYEDVCALTRANTLKLFGIT
jgi:TatD DNase family protein